MIIYLMKTLEFNNMIIVARSVFPEDSKYHKFNLDVCLYKLYALHAE